MKSLIFISSFLLFSQFSVGQTTFMDGSEYYNYREIAQMDSRVYSSYFKETIIRDSIVKGLEYFTVNREQERKSNALNSEAAISYKLYLFGGRTYVTGYYYIDSTAVKDSVTEVLLYDFNLKEGDTMFHRGVEFYAFVIDSVKTIEYADGVKRKTQFAKQYKNEDFSDSWQKHMTLIEGIGSNSGLLYMNVLGFGSQISLVSVCADDNLGFLDTTLFRTRSGDYCDAKHFQDAINRLAKVSVKGINYQTISIYPNPASNTLFLPNDYVGRYTIINSIGETVMSGEVAESIDVSKLLPQLYILTIETKTSTGKAKFLKVD